MRNTIYIILFAMIYSCTPYVTEHELDIKTEKNDTSIIGTWEINVGVQKETYLVIKAVGNKKYIGTFVSSKEKHSEIEKLLLGEA